jgi:superfamily II DNA/RNA helicase
MEKGISYYYNSAHCRRGSVVYAAPIGLVLAPTRELAQQIVIESKKFAKTHSLRSASPRGGGRDGAGGRVSSKGVMSIFD